MMDATSHAQPHVLKIAIENISQLDDQNFSGQGLGLMWRAFHKACDYLESGQRLENLTYVSFCMQQKSRIPCLSIFLLI